MISPKSDKKTSKITKHCDKKTFGDLEQVFHKKAYVFLFRLLSSETISPKLGFLLQHSSSFYAQLVSNEYWKKYEKAFKGFI